MVVKLVQVMDEMHLGLVCLGDYTYENRFQAYGKTSEFAIMSKHMAKFWEYLTMYLEVVVSLCQSYICNLAYTAQLEECIILCYGIWSEWCTCTSI